jgi:hypothetical protein
MLAADFKVVIDANDLSLRFPAISFVCHFIPEVILPRMGDIRFIDSLLSGLANIQYLSD